MAQLTKRKRMRRQVKKFNYIIKKWNPPPANGFKRNIGADWDKSLQSNGIAWVLRDYDKTFLMHR